MLLVISEGVVRYLIEISSIFVRNAQFYFGKSYGKMNAGIIIKLEGDGS